MKSRTGSKQAQGKRKPEASASRLIDGRIRDLDGWRGETLAQMRELILAADPGMTEEWKWNNPVWSHNGIVCTGEAYKNAVKLTFAKGASIPDPSGLFNSSLDGKVRRAIDIREGDKVNARAFKALIKAATARNGEPAGKKVVLLSGGNPQIAKADGDSPVQAWIGALPGWKRDAARRLDALIVRTIPGVRKAVKWNSPLYGIEGRGWFLGVHAFNRYLKLAFFRGAELKPPLPVGSKDKYTRYVHIDEDEPDEKQLARWIKQAAALPGWKP